MVWAAGIPSSAGGERACLMPQVVEMGSPSSFASPRILTDIPMPPVRATRKAPSRRSSLLDLLGAWGGAGRGCNGCRPPGTSSTALSRPPSRRSPPCPMQGRHRRIQGRPVRASSRSVPPRPAATCTPTAPPCWVPARPAAGWAAALARGRSRPRRRPSRLQGAARRRWTAPAAAAAVRPATAAAGLSASSA